MPLDKIDIALNCVNPAKGRDIIPISKSSTIVVQTNKAIALPLI